jgi:hypothetical protein
VSVVRPHAMMDIADAAEIRDVANQAQAKLERALAAITGHSDVTEA